MSELNIMFLDEIRSMSQFDYKDWIRNASSEQRNVFIAERFYRQQKRRLEEGGNSWGKRGIAHVGRLIEVIKTLEAESFNYYKDDGE